MNVGKFAIFYFLFAAISQHTIQAQAYKPESEATITQVRKSVTFIQLKCGQGDQEFDVKGTGFFVTYPDSRLGDKGFFAYLVTNRHVAECWNDLGIPLQVKSISIRLNRRLAENGMIAEDLPLNLSGNVPWILPTDDSVDLAILPFLPDVGRFDVKAVPFSMFIDKSLLSQRKITEGEPVLFSGFFYQFPGSTRIEPIVRQGIVAMMPEDKVPFVRKAMHVYLADLHVFGGNSGSPAFVNLGGIHGEGLTLGEEYRLLGVVNGEVSEDENFNLELSTTFKGTGKANSGISTIVPADELIVLINDPRVQVLRDTFAKESQNHR
jgi:hypothetical protein